MMPELQAARDRLTCHSLDRLVRRQFGDVLLILADCLDVLPVVCDAVVTDPPYPNFLVKEYGAADIEWMAKLPCLQLVFWTVKETFPLDYTAKHIWHKQCGTWATEEAIYERNGASDEERYSYQKIKNKIDAQMNRDVLTGHPSQKPIRLMMRLMARIPNAATVLDPYMGSGTTAIACIRTGRKFVGIEKDVKHFETACERVANELAQGVLFPPNAPDQGRRACDSKTL
jgi:DNA modification methylase